MDKNETRLRLVRETLGVIMIGAGVVGGLACLIVLGGLGLTFATLGAIGLATLGYRLASGTPDETERDSGPLGPGPLFIDPENPEEFIPRP